MPPPNARVLRNRADRENLRSTTSCTLRGCSFRSACAVVRVHCVNSQAIRRLKQFQDSLDPLQVTAQVCRANFDLDAGVAKIQESADFVRKMPNVIAGVRVSSSGVSGHLLCDRHSAHQLREEFAKWSGGSLSSGIPDGHVECPNCDTTFAVAAGLLAMHHDLPCAKWIEVVAD